MRAANRVTRRATRLAAVLGLATALATPAHGADPSQQHLGEEACVAALLDAGRVTVEFYDREGKPSWGGDAVFHADQRNHFTYTYRWFARGESTEVVIDAKASLEILPMHTIHLPRGLNDSTEWYRRLRLHELDHVAVSTDERPRLLARWLVAHLPPVVRRVPRGEVVGTALANRAIGEEIEARYRAVVNLIQAQEARLDSVTAHGVAPLPDREAFFAALYDAGGLAAARFPYLTDVAALLDEPRYRNAPRPRCDPTP